MSIRTLFVFAAAALVACQPLRLTPRPPSDIGLWPDAAGNTASEPLAEVCETHWNQYLEAKPEVASLLGDPRFHGRVADRSQFGQNARVESLWRLEREITGISEASLSESDALTRSLLLREVRAESVALSSGYDEWDPGRALQLLIELTVLPSEQPVASRRERDQLVERWGAFADAVRREREGLLRASSKDRVGPRSTIKRLIEICDRVLVLQPVDNPLVAPAAGGGRWVPLPAELPLAILAERELGSAARQLELRMVNRHLQRGEVRALGTRVLLPSPSDPLEPDERGRFLEAVLDRVERDVLPALAQLRATLADELLPRSRGEQRAGLVHLPEGRELYSGLLANELGDGFADERSFDAAASAVVALQRSVLARGSELLSVESVSGLRDALRSDPRASLRSSDAVIATLEASARDARSRIPTWFGIIPVARYEVAPIFGALAPGCDAFTYVAGDEAATARVYVDRERLAGRSAWEVSALALRELAPGRHMWESSARENSALPRFRRHTSGTAASLGFGQYVLRVGPKLGYIATPEVRLGAEVALLESAALAAMDFAMHYEGWGRVQALEYLVQNVPHESADLAVELELVLAYPGRALASWLTAREFERLFDAERTAQGAAFDATAFHRRLAAGGPLPAGYIARAAATR